MRGLCMTNADKQTYLTQTGPRINGQTSSITSQKEESQAHRRKSNLMGATNTRKQQSSLRIKQSCCQGQKLLLGEQAGSLGDQRPLLGISKGHNYQMLGIFPQFSGTCRNISTTGRRNKLLRWGSYEVNAKDLLLNIQKIRCRGNSNRELNTDKIHCRIKSNGELIRGEDMKLCGEQPPNRNSNK